MRLEYNPLASELRQVRKFGAMHSSQLYFNLFADHDSPAAAFIARRPNLWNTSSDSTFAFIHSWINECDSGHNCTTTHAVLGTPKRLIDLSSRTTISDDVRVIESAAIGDIPRYVALSYCWGDPSEHHQVQTVRANINNHRKCVDFSSCPKTVQDAIIFSRKLKIQYLWVDALCIIQDDEDDKLTEIAAMGQIYANAYLTVAACSAKGSNDGFLEPKANPFFSAPVLLPHGELLDAKWTEFGYGLLDRSRDVVLANNVRLPIKDLEPLHNRGWTFQEALLSKRTLYFSSFQPYWVCEESSRGGGEPSPEEYFTAVELQHTLMPFVREKGDHSKDTPPAIKFGYRWPWVAESYSLRILSVISDKMLAIHAIREQYQNEGGIYVAGVWLRNLAIDLLWSTVRLHTRTAEELNRFGRMYHQGKISNIPSWSWLSFDGSIRNEAVWHAFFSGKICSMRDIASHVRVVAYPPTDLFGRLTGRPLRICGPVKQILILPPRKIGWDSRPQTGSCYDGSIWDHAAGSYTSLTEEGFLGSWIGEAVFDDFIEHPNPDLRILSSLRKPFDIAAAYPVTPMLVECLEVGSFGTRDGERTLTAASQQYNPVYQGNETAYGLLLRDVPGSNGTQKYRIGFFRGVEGSGFYFDGAPEKEFDFV